MDISGLKCAYRYVIIDQGEKLLYIQEFIVLWYKHLMLKSVISDAFSFITYRWY